MKITEVLPNDGAKFFCYRKTEKYPYLCSKPATHLLTNEAFELLDDMFTMRATCAEHATEAAIQLGK